MLSSLLLTTTILATGIQALPKPDAACDQQVSTDQSFSLVAKTTQMALGTNVNNWVVTGVHSGAGQNLAVLAQADPLDSNKVGMYYQNGTASNQDAGTLLARGTGSLIYSMRILPNKAPDASNDIVSIDIGEGSPGNYIGNSDSLPFPHLIGNGDANGQFYVCDTFLYSPNKPVKGIYWRSETGKTPDKCSEVTLVPQCSGPLGSQTQATQDLQPASCFDKALDFQPNGSQSQEL